MLDFSKIVMYEIWYDYLKLNPIVTELFIRGRELSISLVAITQSYFLLPKNIRLNATLKIPNNQELQQIAFNHSSDIDFYESS